LTEFDDITGKKVKSLILFFDFVIQWGFRQIKLVKFSKAQQLVRTG
jgi:hypothetical protein